MKSTSIDEEHSEYFIVSITKAAKSCKQLDGVA